ncbi:hypothetical protein [Methylobacterium iners]|nr:hypothetical protein [Methylobacterium iners]
MDRRHLRIGLSGIVIPAGADWGIQEEHARFASNTTARSWNGRPIIQGPRDDHRHVITLSADGTRWGPTLDDVNVRDLVELHSARFEAARIPAGMLSVVLRRPPVPDPSKPWGYAVLAHRDGEKTRIPVTVAGKVVTLLQAQDVDVSVQYRAIRPCVVTDYRPGTTDTRSGTQGWGLTLVDRT